MNTEPIPSDVSRPSPASPPARGVPWGWLLAGVALAGLPLAGGFLLMLMWLLFSGDAETPAEKHHSLAELAEHKVAIITIEGTILDGDGFVKQQIDRVREDEAVGAVVLRVVSPGGTVAGSDFMYHHLCQLRDERKIPIVVSMGGIAASGGYYVSMAVGDAEQTIFAEPTCWTGSIGVIIPHYNVAGLMEKYEVEDDSIKSHPLKQMASPTKRLSEEEQAILQALVDESFGRFKQIVQAGRPRFREHPEELDRVATGQVFTTQQAIASGLVDREGFIEQAIDRALELAGLNKENTQAVEYERPGSLLDLVMPSAHVQAISPPDWQALLRLNSQRAWFICDWGAMAAAP